MADLWGPVDLLSVEIDRSGCPSRFTVRLHGELDFATVPELDRTLSALLEGGAAHLLIDVSGVSFCAVAGLNLLLRLRAALLARGGELVLLGRCRSLQIMIDALELRDRLPVRGDDDSDDSHDAPDAQPTPPSGA